MDNYIEKHKNVMENYIEKYRKIKNKDGNRETINEAPGFINLENLVKDVKKLKKRHRNSKKNNECLYCGMRRTDYNKKCPSCGAP